MPVNKELLQNRQLELMLVPAKERLSHLTAEQICEKAGVSFDEQTSEIFFDSLGSEVRFSYPSFDTESKLDMWQHLTLLQYLHTANGEALSGEYISLCDMPGGLARGNGFNKDMALMTARSCKNISAAEFLEVCAAFGGTKAGAKADASALFLYAPRFPIFLNFWAADDEFDASCRVLVDKNAANYLGIEAAGGACASLVQKLTGFIDGK